MSPRDKLLTTHGMQHAMQAICSYTHTYIYIYIYTGFGYGSRTGLSSSQNNNVALKKC